ncbi:MAG: 4-hydroxy-tetrahydrodipicolinate synthase [Verrucomicrobia bacterium]|nr:4-hydroxy-tetrahydrodipicolinate synthase [Verrucomicrobiota bacterium]MBV9642518.1 4-hydroxy-tetrahydrodipicolinate synthase [Verrucomicrobiota bacterium]
MFTGTYTAIVTPFKNGLVDETAFRKLVEFQIENGVDGIVPTGTTGEAATLGFDEHLRVIKVAVEEARGRCKIIAGTGSNSTLEAVELTQAAEKLGVDAALLANPYYNKPTQEGVYRHYKQIAEASPLKLMLYNIPSRTAGEIGVETCARLAQDCKNIVSIKEAGGSAERVGALKKILPPEFTILSGDDGLTLPFMAVGAVGVVSVASNVIPRQITDMVNTFLAGRSADALKIHLRYYQLFKDLFIESNPIPVKTALYLMGMIENEFRLPLCEIGKTNQGKLYDTLRALKLV